MIGSGQYRLVKYLVKKNFQWSVLIYVLYANRSTPVIGYMYLLFETCICYILCNKNTWSILSVQFDTVIWHNQALTSTFDNKICQGICQLKRIQGFGHYWLMRTCNVIHEISAFYPVWVFSYMQIKNISSVNAQGRFHDFLCVTQILMSMQESTSIIWIICLTFFPIIYVGLLSAMEL